MIDRRLEEMRRFEELEEPSSEENDLASSEERRRRIVGRIGGVIRAEASARESRSRRMRFVAIGSVAAALFITASVAWRIGRVSSSSSSSRQSLQGSSSSSSSSSTTSSSPSSPSIELPPSGRIALATGNVAITHHGAVATANNNNNNNNAVIDVGDEIASSGASSARLVLKSGATIELVADTRVHMRPPPRPKGAERVAISHGEITVHVPKLGAGESFQVETPDSEVTVHGTSFVVRVSDAGRSEVHVTEGVVSVTTHAGHESSLLHAGDRWPSSSSIAPISAPPTPTPTLITTTALAGKPSTPSPHHSPSAPVASSSSLSSPSTGPGGGGSGSNSSTLGEQNRLLQRALDARRHGNDAHAIQDLDELLSRYPGSPLAQEARVEKFRALERLGQHGKATSEAKRYLADYPTGFAAEEAKALTH